VVGICAPTFAISSYARSNSISIKWVAYLIDSVY
jgi:hypothetical protein